MSLLLSISVVAATQAAVTHSHPTPHAQHQRAAQRHLPPQNRGSSGGGQLCPPHPRSSACQPVRRSTTHVAAAAVAAADAAMEEDRSIQVKLMLAESSGRLDLSECGLTSVPPAVFDLVDLEELSLAGNWLTQLSSELGRLTALKRLQLAGNELEALPESVSALTALEGAWLHGNRLTALPESISALGALTQLSLAGNCLQSLPEGVGGLTALKELSLAGNQLEGALPTSLGQLASLAKLSLHGNRLGPGSLPATVSGLQALEELWLQGNPSLSELPPELGQLARLKHLSAADCALGSVPAELGSLPALQSLSLYGNRLREVPPAMLQSPHLKHLWLEGNPLSPEATLALLEAAPAAPSLASLGLDQSQLERIPSSAWEAAGGRLRPCEVHGSGLGYFKLDLANPGIPTSSSSSDGNGAGRSSGRARVLVVSFGSAPGTPNWGAVLGKIRAGAASLDEADFDVLYVVDPHRAWYGGGDEGYQAYGERLEGLTSQYKHVVLIGDSMGATAALLFAHLATSVHAFCPQIDLASSSIRPGQPREWFGTLRDRILHSVARSAAQMTVHVGNWSHDLDQARILPAERVRVKIYSVDSHRLALFLDRRGKLQQVIRGAVLEELGVPSGQVRLANLV